MAARSVGIIEDDQAIRDSLGYLLRGRGIEPCSFASAADFLGGAEIDALDGLLVDQHMPDMSGIELIELLRSRKIAIPAIMMTGGTDAGLVARAKKAGVLTILKKPIASAELMGWLQLAFIGAARDRGTPH